MRIRALVVLVACWLVTVNSVDDTALAGDLGTAALSARAENVASGTQEDTPEPTPKRPGRIKAPDGRERRTQADEGAVSDARSAEQTQATPVGANGSAPVIVLVTGAAVIGIVATAFQARRTKKNERDESDPMQQSLLFHDMDYAAM